jgi:hypothetical protein
LRVAFAWAAPRNAEAGAGGQGAKEDGASAGGRAVRALGFGVWPLFADGRFDGPQAAAFIRSTDVERIDVARVWEALA